jgi:BioD-like phosphotransacetylase family protein
MKPEIHSPVILGKGVTKEFLDNPGKFNFEEKLMNAHRELSEQYDIVVYEGTGHPGVGSIVDLSNAKVAKLLNAGVIMVVEGGIGSTIDMLNMNLSLFREENVPILGIIVNKVKPEKKEEIEHYLNIKLKQLNLKLLGVLPYDNSLSLPIMEAIRQAVEGRVVLNEEYMNNRIEDFIAGSLIDAEEFAATENLLLVTSIKRIGEAIKKIRAITAAKGLKKSPLSGVIITSDGRQHKWIDPEELNLPYLKTHKIPVITTLLDTYGSVVKVSRIEVKINNRTPWKSKRAIELIADNVDFDTLLKSI